MEVVAKIPEAFAELYEPHRYKVYWGGRGSGKSWAFADALLLLGIQRPLRILCTREIQRSIKESVYSLLETRIVSLGLQGHYKLTDKAVTGTNGTKFFFEGLWRNIDGIKSIEGVDICWIEEANAVSETSWKKLIPTIRKAGSEIWVSFNPELKSDPAYIRFVLEPPSNAHVCKVSWRDNPWLTPELVNEREELQRRSEDEYQHVWEGNLRQFADGAVYGKDLKACEDRITSIPVEKVETNTFWDLGRNDTTAIWFHQRIGHENRFIDYYEARLEDLDHYAKVLKDKGYLYGTHYLPHDAEVINLGTGNRSRKTILEGMGVAPIQVVPRISNINEGIAMTRAAFPTCWFDKERCQGGLDALANYQYVFDEKYDTFRQNPLHNWASNGADAFRQFAQGYTAKSKTKTLRFATQW